MVEHRPAALEAWVQTMLRVGSGTPRIKKLGLHQQKLGSLLIACDVKLEGALYSLFIAEASKTLDIAE